MKQFDVHRNPGRFRQYIPYVVVIQSPSLDRHRRRVVVPLERTSLPLHAGSYRAPHLMVLGEIFIFDPMLVQSLSADVLGPAIANLEPEGDRIIRAVDEIISRV